MQSLPRPPHNAPRPPNRRSLRRLSRRNRPAWRATDPISPPAAGPYPPVAHRRRKLRTTPQMALLLAGGASLALVGLCVLSVLAAVGLLYASGDVLPGVSSAGVELGGKSETQAAQALAETWAARGLLLRDGSRTWTASPAELGITLDAVATAAAAQAWGRSEGGLSGGLRSLLGGVDVEPVLDVNLAQLNAYLQSAQNFIDLPATNAGVRLENGQAVVTPASEGRALDVATTVELLRLDAAGELADGVLDLAMIPLAPAVTDAGPLVAQANALLASPFNVDAYDPISDQWFHWSAPPEVWSAWLTATPAPDSPTGLALSIDAAGAAAFVQTQAAFGDERYIKVEEATRAMQDALARSQTSTVIRVWHGETTVTVGPGETLASIAERVGIPYPYIQAANLAINTDALSVGQELKLPSRDILVPLTPVPHKRIIVSRGQQHLWAYENGQVVFDWVISTGLPTSPTALGVFQVQSHELNAYAEQWNLYMPHFVGFYHPGPNMELMNGFHGFPTRGGGYLLWTDDLGTPVTYGCVLLSLQNAEALYNWAEEGVVVEVRQS